MMLNEISEFPELESSADSITVSSTFSPPPYWICRALSSLEPYQVKQVSIFLLNLQLAVRFDPIGTPIHFGAWFYELTPEQAEQVITFLDARLREDFGLMITFHDDTTSGQEAHYLYETALPIPVTSR